MALKVAIVGMSDSCADAPWNDPAWEKWGMPWHGEYWARMDRLFEIHDPYLALRDLGERYLEKLRELTVPLYTQHEYDGIDSVHYPVEDVIRLAGREHLTSSVAYMIALAIHEGAEEIALYGVDINENQYGYQRPCLEFWLGVAVGKGIKVSTQPSSALFSYQSTTDAYIGRYGWLG